MTGSALSGISFPFRFSSSGGVAVATSVDKVKANLNALIMSKKKERLIRANVGTIAYGRVLRSMSETSGMIADFIAEAALEFEPNIAEVRVTVTRERGKNGNSVFATLHFRVKGSMEQIPMKVELT